MSKIVFFSDLHYAPELPINNGSRIERKLMWYAEPMLEQITTRINNEDLKANYNPKIDKYTNENLFTCLDIYLNTFGLLNSNVELLRKVF